MLGFSSSREPVRGEVAKEIRGQLFRMAGGALQSGTTTASSSVRSTNYRLIEG